MGVGRDASMVGAGAAARPGPRGPGRRRIRSAGARRGFSRLAVGLCALAAVALGAAVTPGFERPTPAAAQTAARTARTFTARHSGQCLAVADAATSAGAGIVQQPCTSGLEQTWWLNDVGGGWYQLTSAQSDLCLTVPGGTTADATQLVQQPCVAGATYQQFSFNPATGSPATLIVRHDSKCVDVYGGFTTAGTQVIQWPCNGGTNQSWGQTTVTVNTRANGRWTGVINLPLVPAAAAGLANGKVLLWSAWANTDFGGNTGTGLTQTVVYDPTQVTYTQRQVTNTGHDMFCPGTANLADGRILVNGGNTSQKTSIYDPTTDTWTAGADMNIPRGYEGTTVTSTGSVLTLGGSWSGGQGGKDGELWTQATGWKRLSGVSVTPFVAPDPAGVYRGDNHLWLFGWKNGTVFQAGPSQAMHWIDTKGTGSVSNAGNRGTDAYAMNGNAVMYEPGKILTLGGAPAYDNGTATANATVIDLNGPTVTSRAVAPLNQARAMHNSVVLPDGQVVVVGGVPVAAAFSDTNAVMTAEIWNPATERFTAVAPMTVPRNYHSWALLQPDGRVLVGGGGLCGTCAVNHPNLQVYSPPYLFNADGSPATQPRITSAPTKVDLNQVFTVGTNVPVSKMVLVRLASATHSVDNDQRRIPLTMTEIAPLTYQVTAPSDPGVAIPGNYMLFALDANGVPSVARTVLVTNQVAANQPAALTGTVTNGDGSPAAGVSVDLFTADASGNRSAYLTSVTTDSSGKYRFDVAPGCYVLTFIAPTGRTFTGGNQYFQPSSTCAGSGQTITGLDARLNGGGTTGGSLGGTVTDAAGPVPGVAVDLFTALADGSRGTFIGATATDATGNYRFDASPGCYVLTFIAPTGRTFTGGSQWYQPSGCVTAGQSTTGLDAKLSGGTTGTSLSGAVTASGGAGVGGVDVDLFAALADGSRGAYLGSTTTDATGKYRFDVTPGCYVLTLIAPTGRTFTGGSQWYQPSGCVTAGQNLTGFDATLA